MRTEECRQCGRLNRGEWKADGTTRRFECDDCGARGVEAFNDDHTELVERAGDYFASGD